MYQKSLKAVNMKGKAVMLSCNIFLNSAITIDNTTYMSYNMNTNITVRWERKTWIK